MGQGMYTAVGECAVRVAPAARRVGLLALAALVAVAALSPAACVVEGGVSASASAGSGGPGGTDIAVAGPPPPPLQEAPPPPPAPASVWIAGYWHWTGMRYTWIPGHWERSPNGGAWQPPRYYSRDGTYFYEPGGWARPAR